jgi:hypothetical protein
MAINYYESSNRYTDPVRYFKANDPYYFEVDNIPIKQLEENSKFLKDQVDGILRNAGRFFEGEDNALSRTKFNELKPVVDGTNNTVRVLPGRYTTRVNDAYSLTPLQLISQIFDPAPIGNVTSENTDVYFTQTAKATYLSGILDRWQSYTVNNATHMNGLFERCFVYGMQDNDKASTRLETNTPDSVRPSNGTWRDQECWPGYIGSNPMSAGGNLTNTFLHELYRTMVAATLPTHGEHFRGIGILEGEFIRRWRGVTRTSIVDVPQTLEIDIPDFDEEDFFYWNENDEKVTIPDASQRIDLLFIYSKPVDQPETKIASYANGVPRTITEPTLGIVKGAGLGVHKWTSNNAVPKVFRHDLQDSEGNTSITPNPSDELSENTGFYTSASVPIRGSFPSPDDLMNLAPLLAENLSTTSVALVGQTILPVAYIVVKKTAGVNELGQTLLTDDDIIDIRPFFRTTELAYNERAGIAAATPQISLANPVVSEGHLELEKYKITTATDQKLLDLSSALVDLINIRNVEQDLTRVLHITLRTPYKLYNNVSLSEWGSPSAIGTLGRRNRGGPVLTNELFGNNYITTKTRIVSIDLAVQFRGLVGYDTSPCTLIYEYNNILPNPTQKYEVVIGGGGIGIKNGSPEGDVTITKSTVPANIRSDGALLFDTKAQRLQRPNGSLPRVIVWITGISYVGELPVQASKINNWITIDQFRSLNS